jgi:isoleucyl-tRNA synthetase
VDVQKLKPIMRETNENVNWFPSHFKYGRFLKSMEGAPDWCISRSRYWGSPVPVWECECGERFVPGSIAELEARSGSKIADLHKPDIDDVTLKCKKCSKTIHRVPEVLDSWIEAGSAAFAERHFPFDENGHELSIQKQQEYLRSFFPPDFISEYTGQIRAWFYVLHVIAAALYHKPAFKNVLVSGVILGTDGRKMSKNYKNYPDPKEVIEKYGGDALRLYLLGSPITKAEDINISEQEYKDQLRKFIIPLLNIWNFFETYAQVDNFQFSPSTLQGIFNFQTIRGNNNVLDKWLLSRLHSTVKAITDALEQYDTSTAVAFMGDFVNDWSKWHVRRSRDRVGTGELTEDANEYYETTAYVFERFLRAIAPIVPFHSEYLYRKLTKEDSVHLQSWPEIDEVYVHPDLEANTAIARQICEIGHQIRKTNSWKVRHPLAKLEITIEADCSTIQENIWRTVLEELNVKNVVINGKYRYPYTEVVVTDEELKREGELRDLLREIQAMRKEKGVGINEKIQVILPEKYADYIEEVKTHIKTNTVTLGQSLEVSV